MHLTMLNGAQTCRISRRGQQAPACTASEQVTFQVGGGAKGTKNPGGVEGSKEDSSQPATDKQAESQEGKQNSSSDDSADDSAGDSPDQGGDSSEGDDAGGESAGDGDDEGEDEEEGPAHDIQVNTVPFDPRFPGVNQVQCPGPAVHARLSSLTAHTSLSRCSQHSEARFMSHPGVLCHECCTLCNASVTCTHCSLLSVKASSMLGGSGHHSHAMHVNPDFGCRHAPATRDTMSSTSARRSRMKMILSARCTSGPTAPCAQATGWTSGMSREKRAPGKPALTRAQNFDVCITVS